MLSQEYTYKKSMVYGLYLVPAIMIGFDVLRSFSSKGIGTSEMFLFLLYTIALTVKAFRKTLNFNPWVYLFFAYLLILSPYTSHHERTYRNLSWLIISISMLPLGYAYIRDIYQFRKLNQSIFWVLILFTANALVTSTLGIGENPYGGALKMGAFIYSVLYSGSIGLLLLPLLLPYIKKPIPKIILYGVSVLVFVFLVLSMRRTAMGIPVIGYFIYFFFTSYKKQIASIFLITATILALTFPFYQEILMDQFSARENVFGSEYNVEEELRWLETLAVVNERWLDDIPWSRTLLGSELFNSSERYAGGAFGRRPLHVDYNKILWGAGLIGMLLYLAIYADMVIKLIRYNKYLPDRRYYKEMKNIFITLLIVSLFISTQGGMFTVTFRAMIFIYFGAILGVFSKFYERGIKHPRMEFNQK
ncbi:MAG: hypothetical protein JXB24_13385 [Bacteroidales bacterium]|nr:hypothetical protein [Bacteroidales bacterium]